MQTLKVCQTFNKVLTVHQEVEKENVSEHAHIYIQVGMVTHGPMIDSINQTS